MLPRLAGALLLLVPFATAYQDRSRPRVHVPTIRDAPTIDGELSEPSWSEAIAITELTEVEPVEGIPADPPTRILLMRDDRALYVAFECFEPHPERMVVQDMKRDGSMSEDESVKVVLDTFSSGKNAVWFVLSAAGGRLDALLTDNGQRVNKSWDGVWQGRTRILADRWIAEIAIPFTGLAFPESGVWRGNFERYHGARRAYYRWQGARRQFRVTTVSEFGELSGFDDIPPTLGLELVPYLSASGRIDRTPGAESTDDLGVDAGGEVNWQVTPQLAASVSVNTDFAEIEADTPQVNLTRFGITFPEKRDFFLRDSELFEFGWESGFSGGANIVPFRSRRVGLAPDGSEVPIDVAARLAGRVGPLGLGTLAMRTGAAPAAGVPEGDLAVVRPSWRFTEELSAGAIVTSGDPTSDGWAHTAGVDLEYSNSENSLGLLNFNGWALRSENGARPLGTGTSGGGSTGEEPAGAGDAFGLRSTLRTSDWSWALSALQSDKEFYPALGFVRRPGERQLAGSVSWRPRPSEASSIRNYNYGISPSFWTDLSGKTISSSIATTLFGISWQDGDSFSFSHAFVTDELEHGFDPVAGSTIEPGSYGWHTLGAGFGFSRTRALSGFLSINGGNWYDGRMMSASTSCLWRPSPVFDLSGTYSHNDVDLPDSHFVTHVETLSMGYSVTPDLRSEVFVRHDNVSEDLGFQGRVRWSLEDGRELHLVTNLNWSRRDVGGGFVPADQELLMKLEYAFRF